MIFFIFLALNLALVTTSATEGVSHGELKEALSPFGLSGSEMLDLIEALDKRYATTKEMTAVQSGLKEVTSKVTGADQRCQTGVVGCNGHGNCKGNDQNGYHTVTYKENVQFQRPFVSIPSVHLALREWKVNIPPSSSGFPGEMFGFETRATKVTKWGFEAELIQGDIYTYDIEAIWIACESV